MKEEEIQTANSFRDHWADNPNRAFSKTLKKNSEIPIWILNRNGFYTLEDVRV